MAGAKPKTIRKVLATKIEDWLSSIEDQGVRAVARQNVIVTGGAIVSMLLGEPIKDFDIYFKTKAAALVVSRYYVEKFKEKYEAKYEVKVLESTVINRFGVSEDIVEIFIASSGMVSTKEADQNDIDGYDMEGHGEHEQSVAELLKMSDDRRAVDVKDDTAEKTRYSVSFMSSNAITLTDKIQLVTRFTGEPDAIHANFDFAHAMSSYDYANNKLVMPDFALQAILSRTLVYKGSLYPIASLFRMKKFLQRGWKISAGEILKIAVQVNQLELTNLSQLKQQLTGVDMAYLGAVMSYIEASKASAANNGDEWILTEGYFIEVIDRVFGF